MASRPSLHQSLYRALQSVPTEKASPRTFELMTLCTKPFRTYTLFPHALDPRISITRTDYLIMLAEKFEDYRTPSPTSPPPQVIVPVFALEASLYTIPTTSVQLLYISKIDTTGLAPLPAPAGQLTIAFLTHFLQHMPKSIHSLRIHIFARAAREGQYLFPASAENGPNGNGDGAKFASKNDSTQDSVTALPYKRPAGKRILDDQQLVKWWHKILSQLTIGYHQLTTSKNPLECFYILPGFDHEESLEVLPLSSECKALWNYGHPYHKIASPFAPTNHHSQTSNIHPGADRPRGYLLSDLIPAFNDDPKARFLHSIGDCSTTPSGEPGDWDDAIVERSSAALESDRNRERTKINQVSPDEFWDRMGGRQECCDGRVSAFFVVALTRSNPIPTSGPPSSVHTQPTKNASADIASHQADSQSVSSNLDNGIKPVKLTDSDEAQKKIVGVPRNVWVSLWSKIHNKDYGTLENLTTAYTGWIDDVKSSINSAVLEDNLKKKRKLEEKGTNLKQDKVNGGCEPNADKHDKPVEERPQSSSSHFEDCYSVILVDNSLMNHVNPTESGSNGPKSSGPSSNQQKRTQVNVLQPRKKPKK
ncbi:hypothetical protein, variant [Puccinia triticina 1-1 BBBD Race 1]|uniref:histone acetyltransferase n=2 Tax=Puccinia triticina TaxID=208348 RepID=A0A180G7D8_PUCT1|nr:uncharacterized protein PtA15_2A122 [Puccinia triticina]OAV88477.1 hypothetical protein PTTG_09549 [Puccinia triticina 1-1 BBBD Race 1]OAV88478.1 hypothetical protein, variant [Puccinia triticina 1-1 BBBD Race 1]WAQ81810.1 hypothetical protein PtA15_2A122 [Puccinia triticina]WAR52700.1 hypothetical protein PtB15_2B125 [Puccinia triticina]